MKKILLLLISTSALFLGACASKEKVKQIDVKIEEKGTAVGGVIGLNDDGEAIIQTQTKADQELRGLIWQNNDLEMGLNHEVALLERCREEIADPRLGGNGEIVEIPEIDRMKPTTDLKRELGLVGSDLVVVTKESLPKRLQAERTYQESLEKMSSQVKKHRKNCEFKMGVARTKAGLPSQRYQGKITITPDGKVGQVLERHENNLDDAFDINESKKNLRTPAGSYEEDLE